VNLWQKNGAELQGIKPKEIKNRKSLPQSQSRNFGIAEHLFVSKTLCHSIKNQ
jgi:hypothetical protein